MAMSRRAWVRVKSAGGTRRCQGALVFGGGGRGAAAGAEAGLR